MKRTKQKNSRSSSSSNGDGSANIGLLLDKFTLQQSESKSVRHTLDNSIWISVYFILLSQRIHKIYINFEYVLFRFFFCALHSVFCMCFVCFFFTCISSIARNEIFFFRFHSVVRALELTK